MPSSNELLARANNQCELCTGTSNLETSTVSSSNSAREGDIVTCEKCRDQLDANHFDNDDSHWKCLGDSMWSSVLPVQIMAWRILSRLRQDAWAQDLLDMLYLDEDAIEWAKDGWQIDARVFPKDSNGVKLNAGDSITIIKDLNVKGTSFVAKRGTLVQRISLTDNPEHIEGKVNGTKIVILTCFVKKS